MWIGFFKLLLFWLIFFFFQHGQGRAAPACSRPHCHLQKQKGFLFFLFGWVFFKEGGKKLKTAPGHMSQLKRETTTAASRSPPISHPGCLGGRLQWGILLLLSSQGFRGVRSDFLNSHTNSGQSPHQTEPVGFSHFFPPSWFNNSLLLVTAHSPGPYPKAQLGPPNQSPSPPPLQGRPGTSGRAIQIYLFYFILFFV